MDVFFANVLERRSLMHDAVCHVSRRTLVYHCRDWLEKNGPEIPLEKCFRAESPVLTCPGLYTHCARINDWFYIHLPLVTMMRSPSLALCVNAQCRDETGVFVSVETDDFLQKLYREACSGGSQRSTLKKAVEVVERYMLTGNLPSAVELMAFGLQLELVAVCLQLTDLFILCQEHMAVESHTETEQQTCFNPSCPGCSPQPDAAVCALCYRASYCSESCYHAHVNVHKTQCLYAPVSLD